MTDWVRLWHDMPTDPKWRTIARKSGQRVGDVIAVFNFIIVNASANAADRGTLAGFDVEDVATALDIDEQDVTAIMAAMQGKVLDGERLSGWEKRQPKREDNTAAARKAAWKERQKNGAERIGTQRNAPETETETDILDANASMPISPSETAEVVELFRPEEAPANTLTAEHVVEAWNDLAGRLGKPRIRDLTPERRQRVRARIAGYSLDDWRAVLGAVERSSFLRGDTGWHGFTFDWLTKKANFQKVLEGNYDDKSASSAARH